MAGIGASLRANTAADLQRVFFDPIDKAHSAEMIATILGLPFLGFALTIAMMGAVYDAKKIEVAGGEQAFDALQPGPGFERVLGAAAQTSFRVVAILPAVLLIELAASGCTTDRATDIGPNG